MQCTQRNKKYVQNLTTKPKKKRLLDTLSFADERIILNVGCEDTK